ncbi:SAF domain-containing protein [Prauserella marina]|uniref:SAF domain-containing protein n=1 Tax=Prauserella marina TaxID=530584 RepID=UPI001FE3BA32|nr:SAF domain-containing protein [Prauserella marina]
MTLAVVLAAIATYGNYALITSQDDRVDVLVLTREVRWGQPVAESDLGVAKVFPDQRLSFISASQRADTVGQVARGTLPAGTVLTPAQLGTELLPGPGERLLGLPVKPGNLPARGVAPGDLVQVSPAKDSAGNNDATQGSADMAKPLRARVVGVGPPDSTGAVTVDVVVGEDAARTATDLAGAPVVVVQLGPGA